MSDDWDLGDEEFLGFWNSGGQPFSSELVGTTLTNTSI
jgi:hypothetical protein